MDLHSIDVAEHQCHGPDTPGCDVLPRLGVLDDNSFSRPSILCTSSFVLSVQADDFKPADKSAYSTLCMKALQGNRAAMHNEIKVSGLSSKFVAVKVQCSGKSILS